MRTLDEIGLRYGTDKASSHHDYLRTYALYFDRLREEPITLLEIGVQFGFSIRTWLEYFPAASIGGVDLSVDHKIKDPRFSMSVGNADNREFWMSYNPFLKPWNIIIDDASHRGPQQKTALEMLWAQLAPYGLYCIEDVQTWWDSDFNREAEGTGILGGLVRDLNWAGKFYFGKPRLPKEPPKLGLFEDTLAFVHCYHGLVILGKKG